MIATTHRIPRGPLRLRTPKPVPALAVLATLATSLAVGAAPAAAGEVFSNQTPITIPNKGAAAPYPSTINVQRQSGRITDVTVSLRQFSHTRPEDVDVLLASPTGETSVVMSDACVGPVQSLTWFFTQAVTESMPKQPGTCDGVLYRPTDIVGETLDFWPNAPFGTAHFANLDRFIGEPPNGVWSLYVVDDNTGESGKIANGWTLGVDTAVPDVGVPRPGADSGPADRYPAERVVSGMTGVITDVDVSLPRIYHPRLDDLELLLLGPRGQTVLLMSDACGQSAGKDQFFRWDDEAESAMPATGSCPSATYRPTDRGIAQEPLPAPAPDGPYATSLSALDLSDPNGQWLLYASDDNGPSAKGFFVDRFTLHLETRPEAAVTLTPTSIEVTEGETTEVVVTRDAGAQATGPGTVIVRSAPLAQTSAGDFTPVTETLHFEPGQVRKTVTVEALADAVVEDAEAFALTTDSPTGDAQLGDPSTATVTIRDATPAPAPADTPDPGGAPGPQPAGTPDPGPGGGPPGDRTAPLVRGLTLAPRRFAVARRTARRAARRGTTIGYRLSEPATVTLRFVHAATGRHAGTLRRQARAGANRIRFTGRIGRRTLRPGAYRLSVTATDAAGNRSARRTARLRVVR